MQPNIGRGFGFPLFVNGRLRITTGPQRIRELILAVLLTRKGTRVMRPDFGSSLHELAFRPNGPGLRAEARMMIEEALIRWEPRVEVVDVNTDESMIDALVINLSYRVLATDEFENVSLSLQKNLS